MVTDHKIVRILLKWKNSFRLRSSFKYAPFFVKTFANWFWLGTWRILVIDFLLINSFNNTISILRHSYNTFFKCNASYKHLLSVTTSIGIHYVPLNKSPDNTFVKETPLPTAYDNANVSAANELWTTLCIFFDCQFNKIHLPFSATSA